MDLTKFKFSVSPRLRPYLIGLVVFTLLFGAFGFFAGPPIARSVLLKVMAKELHRPVSLGEISINPYAMSVRISGLKIGEGEAGEVFGFDELYVNLDLASILHAAPVIEELRVTSPRIRLVREEDGRYNISDLLDEWLKPSDTPTPSFSVNNIRVTGGRIDFDDRPVGKQHAVTDINVSLPFISNLSYQANLFTEPAFSATINGATLALTGKTKPFSEAHESELSLDLDRFELARYLAYLPKALPFTVTGGEIGTDIRLVFRQAPKEPTTLNISGSVTLTNLHLLEDGGKPLLNLARLEVPLKGVAPLNNRYQFGAIGIEGLEVFVRVHPGGSLNWQTLAGRLQGGGSAGPVPDKARPDAGKAKPPQAAATQPAKPLDLTLDGLRLGNASLHWQDGGNPDDGPSARLERFEIKGLVLDAPKQHVGIAELALNGLKLGATRLPGGAIAGLQALASRPGDAASPAPRKIALAGKGRNAAPPWLVEIAAIKLADIGLRLDDKAVKPTSVQELELSTLKLEKFSTAPKTSAPLELAMLINKKGSLQVSGPLQLSPLSAKLKVSLRGFDLLPLQPYFGERLNLTVTRGQITSEGELALDTLPDGSLGGGYAGQITLGNFHSVDKINSANFLTWRSLHLGRMNAAFKPFALGLGEVALTDFYARLIVSPEGKLNVLHLVKKDEAQEAATQKADAQAPAQPAAAQVAPGQSTVAAAPAPADPPPAIRIDKVTLQGGTVSFSDRFIKPNYTAKLEKIGGRITGLSSNAGSAADLDLRGTYDGAPLSIKGTLNPLAALPTLDIKAEVRGVELTPLSAYSGKYAGYAIDKGKLSLYLGYKIADNKLQADNRIFLDQLTFGNRTDSPDATKLPVTLAVALLQNRKGEIDINLPISGSLDSPDFSVGGIIVQVIVNLLTKALTSPFALLGSLFGGGGEELSHVAFAPGRARLTPEAVKRLENLAKALDDRPSLKLEIFGRFDPEKDGEGLRQASLERKVKARKHAQMVKEIKEAGAVEEVVIDEKEYEALLEQAYKLEKFPKPRNFIGLTKSLPREEMEKLMLAHVAVGDDELRSLANRRAKAIAEWLRANSAVPAERVFLLPPKPKADGGGPKDSPFTRADFSLQ